MSIVDKPVIGVLALQGAVELHKPHIEAGGGTFRAVKTPAEFEGVDAFILPGGESTTMLRLVESFKLWDTLEEHFRKKPVWGICAGTILMAEKSFVTDNLASRSSKASPEGETSGKGTTQKSFGLLPITVQRNAYGTQLQSHQSEIDGYPVSFIRAPVIRTVSKNVQILATHKDTPVWVQKDKYMASTFHAELTLDFPSPMHKRFVEMV